MKIGLVAPHIFMQSTLLPKVIFSPGQLAIDLADELVRQGQQVSLYTPGKVTTLASNITADLVPFEAELNARGDTYLDLLKKHPLTFISLARQVQAEIIAKAFADANDHKLDMVHIYMNEEDIALPFSEFCNKPVVFTHHDPFSFLAKYRALFPKYKHLNWLSMSMSQRAEMPAGTNWAGNIYHGLRDDLYKPVANPSADYVAFLGRLIEPKGAHLAIAAIKKYNQKISQNLSLKIAGKHYSGSKDKYWQTRIVPELNESIQYVGYLKQPDHINDFLGNAKALIVPSLFNEPFGMVTIEALACGTPVIGLSSGAIPEIITANKTGFIVKYDNEESATDGLVEAIEKLPSLKRSVCRSEFEQRFTLKRMAAEHISVYERLTK